MRIGERFVQWKATIALIFTIISGTIGAIFWAFEYFETKSNAAYVQCQLQRNDRINEFHLEIVNDEISEFRLSSEIYVLKQGKQNQNIIDLIETKQEQRKEVLKRILLNQGSLNETKEKTCSY